MPWSESVFILQVRNDHLYLKIDHITEGELCVYNNLTLDPIVCTQKAEILDFET